ncbi:MAG: glycerol-3-phosphate dehydrogenase [Rhodospirillales bacterium]|nr:glycerol-3-phosphate dehydrogenase [Rhodospirillales bacterium]
MQIGEPVDLLIIGGGINGVGIARDAAGRGLSVVLCEQGDLGGATSSASTKLIHGGLRYLEFYRFGLVREALAEREVLLRLAPHIVSPMRFVLPHEDGRRPAWLIRLGLFLYDHLSHRTTLSRCQGLDLARHPAGAALKGDFGKGFAYSDCWVDDARLVVLNALSAAERGAEVLVRTRLASAEAVDGQWRARLVPIAGPERTVRARAIVNAAGPWAGRVAADILGLPAAASLRLVKGSHIVVPRLFGHDMAYVFQQPDRRILFAIPYQDRFTLIGTTEVDFDGDPAGARIDNGEIAYLCQAAGRYFRAPVDPAAVVWSYSGVRPLYGTDSGTASAVSREYRLEVAKGAGGAPALSVFGGKITTYRRLAERALDRLRPFVGLKAPPWTGEAPLPGGDLGADGVEGLLARLADALPWLPAPLRRRYAGAYGNLVFTILDGAGQLDDLGEDFGGGLYAAEVRHLVNREWARTPDDVLWRRTKLGLCVAEATRARLAAWMAGQESSR